MENGETRVCMAKELESPNFGHCGHIHALSFILTQACVLAGKYSKHRVCTSHTLMLITRSSRGK